MAAGGPFSQKKYKKLCINLKWPGMRSKLFAAIQNGHRRPFCQKFTKIIKIRMDLKWQEMPSKVNFGNPNWPIDHKWPEMQSKLIFGHPKWPPEKKSVSIWNGQNCYQKWISDIQKWPIDLKWPEMQSKVIFENPKCPPAAIFCYKFHNKIHIDLKWPEMCSKVNFGHPKWPMAAILSKIYKKKKKLRIDLKWPEISDIQNSRQQPLCQKCPNKLSCISIWNGQKCHRKWISDIQNGRRQPFCQNLKKKLHIDLKWPEMGFKVNFGHPKWEPAAIL